MSLHIAHKLYLALFRVMPSSWQDNYDQYNDPMQSSTRYHLQDVVGALQPTSTVAPLPSQYDQYDHATRYGASPYSQHSEPADYKGFRAGGRSGQKFGDSRSSTGIPQYFQVPSHQSPSVALSLDRSVTCCGSLAHAA